jgi:hypothetical protein
MVCFLRIPENLHVRVFDAFIIRLKMYSLPVSINLPEVNGQACFWRKFLTKMENNMAISEYFYFI